MRRQVHGDEPELDAAIRALIDGQGAGLADDRVYLRRRPRPGAGVWLVLIDNSASVLRGRVSGFSDCLSLARLLAALIAQSVEAIGGRCAIHAFSSCGRHAISYRVIQGFGEGLASASLGRLAGIDGGGSTRLGAAIRHASRLLAAQQGVPRRLLLISDGDVHDIDVHDPHYLVADAADATAEARRRGNWVACLDPGGQGGTRLRRIFGPAAASPVNGIETLPLVMARLLH